MSIKIFHPCVRLGLSPRGTIALLKMTKATALLNGRDFAIPDDTLYAFKDVCMHRILLNSKAKINGMNTESVLKEIVAAVQIPKIKR